MAQKFDLVVVGEGIAGLTCASHAVNAGLDVATIEAEFFGGLVVNINTLENFEAAQGESGMTFAGMLATANKKAGVHSISAEVAAIDAVDGGFEVRTETGVYAARFVVIASGARWKTLGIPGEAEFNGRGVSHCADCDAPMFTGEAVVVAGGGNWALQSALLLAEECDAVSIMDMRAGADACEEYLSRVNADPKISLYPELSITEIVGNEAGMTGVRVRDARGAETEVAASGLFAMAELVPNGDIAPVQAQRDGARFLIVNDDMETNIAGLFAIGQVRSGFPGWLNDAVSDGQRAAQRIRVLAG
ncbi:FAD-dependent oxidoreductase [Pusillimonas sp. TS35]|uniref:NAD(P)/FAD-dependent oxidoreductase n=1 Tax=Paracandidimonas lactea TaxID=2895524 RepID=UPI00136AB735|nr:NAD(P)/FAD-dependent oxidoreductase [Paracandidimonas lactea]MYN13913.1 FAD-dependent oxidoreductase [Pusillimonas sp. TS35]